MALLLLAAAIAAGTVQAAAAAAPERLVFPIAGPATWTDDFGAPRAQGSHEGNDILSSWKAPAVAVEAGKVRIWNRDGGGSAGCMLYLYGKSGTTYLYIHLNNDLTPRNDGKGGCVPGVAFAPGLKDGTQVQAGELLGYVGSSGDAGATNHLHFELHPDDGAAVSPFRWLKRAERPLYALAKADGKELAGAGLTLTLTGTVKGVELAEAADPGAQAPGTPADAPSPGGSTPPEAPEAPGPGQMPVTIISKVAARSAVARVTIAVTSVELSNGEEFEVERTVTVTVPVDAVVQRQRGGGLRATKVGSAKSGEAVTLTTAPFAPTLATQLARPGALAAAQVVFG